MQFIFEIFMLTLVILEGRKYLLLESLEIVYFAKEV